MEKNREIGLTMTYLYPWATFPPLGLLFARWLMEKSGCEWLELFINHSVGAKLPSFLEGRVKFVHAAYNPATFQQVWRKEKTQWRMTPKWRDPLLSPGPGRCFEVTKTLGQEFPLIVIRLEALKNPWGAKELLLEVHNGLGLSGEGILDLARERDVRLVIDTKYQRREEGESSALGNWRKSLPLVLQKAGFIRIQPFATSELKSFLSGSQTELRRMCQTISEFGGPIAIAVNRGIVGNLNLWQLIKTLKEFHQVVEGCF